MLSAAIARKHQHGRVMGRITKHDVERTVRSVGDQQSDPLSWIEKPSARLGFGNAEVAPPPTTEELVAFAKRISAMRGCRNNFLSDDLLGEPGYDMMLALFIADADGHRLTVSDLTRASGVPSTTALRWMATLQERGLTRRRLNNLDARMVFIELEPKGRDQVAAFLKKALIQFRTFYNHLLYRTVLSSLHIDY